MKNRLPALREVIPVYAVIAFMVYAWAIVVFLWNLPAWLFYLYLDEILTILAYRMLASLVESLLIMGALLALCFVLPPAILKDAFILRGTSTAVSILGSIVLFWNRFLSGDVYFWMVGSIVLAALAGFISTRIKWLSSFLRWLSDSMVVFLYILIPSSILSLILVLLRNTL